MEKSPKVVKRACTLNRPESIINSNPMQIIRQYKNLLSLSLIFQILYCHNYQTYQACKCSEIHLVRQCKCPHFGTGSIRTRWCSSRSGGPWTLAGSHIYKNQACSHRFLHVHKESLKIWGKKILWKKNHGQVHF